MLKFIFFFLLTVPAVAAVTSIDRSAKSFEMRQKKHVDVFDFSGSFLQLENIDIDARRKKRVEFCLTGEYPILESVHYDGSFGSLKGDLTGDFPKLKVMNFLCTSCAMNLDLRGQFHQSAQINIRGMKEDLVLKLPEDVGLIIHTKTAAKGKVVAREGLKKQGWMGILNKTFTNEIATSAPIVLEINVETSEGRIILN